MVEQYYIDLESFSLERFKYILETREVLPSRKMLKENISERFAMLEAMGIKNLKDLIDALSTKEKVEQFSQKSGLSQEYLKLLKLQTRIYTPNPMPLKDIPGIEPKHIEQLAVIGIRQTKQLFERAISKQNRTELSRLANVPDEALLELVKLSDLARAGWVGPIFARLIYETGADTLDALSKCSAEVLFERLLAVNREQKLTKASFTLKDVVTCIDVAKDVPKVVEY